MIPQGLLSLSPMKDKAVKFMVSGPWILHCFSGEISQWKIKLLPKGKETVPALVERRREHQWGQSPSHRGHLCLAFYPFLSGGALSSLPPEQKPTGAQAELIHGEWGMPSLLHTSCACPSRSQALGERMWYEEVGDAFSFALRKPICILKSKKSEY